VTRSNPPHGRGSGDGTPPSPAPRADGLAEAIATLGTMLQSASTIANDLAAGGLFDRLQQVFTRMPAEDREVILRVLEREVEFRCFSRGTGDTATGYETRPNPNARLYLRVLTDQEPPPVMDRDELVVANYRGLRVLRFVLGPLHDLWLETIRDAVALLDPEERAAARQILVEGLAALDRLDATRPR
jgi:hypothetical protein